MIVYSDKTRLKFSFALLPLRAANAMLIRYTILLLTICMDLSMGFLIYNLNKTPPSRGVIWGAGGSIRTSPMIYDFNFFSCRLNRTFITMLLLREQYVM